MSTMMLSKAAEAARCTGVLTLDGCDLDSLPAWIVAETQGGGGRNEGTVDFERSSSAGGWWETTALKKATLSRNRLKTLPDVIGQEEFLTHLDVSYNLLEELPILSGLAELRLLNVTSNELKSLANSQAPQTSGLPPSLIVLNCNDNKLESLPHDIGGCEELTEVRAEGNRIRELPGGLSRCRELTTLNLRGNMVTGLPADFCDGCPKLQNLDISKNVLERIPENIGSLKALKCFDFRENKVRVLPESLGKCRALVELYAGMNALTELPPTLAEAHELKTLDLDNNSIKNFPKALCTLNLRLLDLCNNELTALPPELGRMESLRKIVLDGNPIRSIRREVLQGQVSHLLRYLAEKMEKLEDEGGGGGEGGHDEIQGFSLSGAIVNGNRLCYVGKHLKGVPKLPSSSTITAIDLHNNKIECGLEGIAEMAKLPLTELDLSYNNIKYWPLGSDVCRSLKHLNLGHNPISVAPSAGIVSTMTSLRYLDLSGIKIVASLVPEICHLVMLQELLLQSCRLSTFPDALLNLQELLRLSLSGNTISTIPESITRLKKLQTLDLTNNDIGRLPPQVGLMHPTLRKLNLEGNPLRTIRRNILDKGTVAVLEHLRNKLPDQQR